MEKLELTFSGDPDIAIKDVVSLNGENLFDGIIPMFDEANEWIKSLPLEEISSVLNIAKRIKKEETLSSVQIAAYAVWSGAWVAHNSPVHKSKITAAMIVSGEHTFSGFVSHEYKTVKENHPEIATILILILIGSLICPE